VSGGGADRRAIRGWTFGSLPERTEWFGLAGQLPATPLFGQRPMGKPGSRVHLRHRVTSAIAADQVLSEASPLRLSCLPSQAMRHAA